jgi:hypothetical protein
MDHRHADGIDLLAATARQGDIRLADHGEDHGRMRKQGNSERRGPHPSVRPVRLARVTARRRQRRPSVAWTGSGLRRFILASVTEVSR